VLLGGPIHGALLGTDQLAAKARSVAARERVLPRARSPRAAPLLNRLSDTRRILNDACEQLAAGAARNVDVGPAGEWLLDNLHVVQEHIREVHETLPRGYYRELPELASGRLDGYPRVYELAIALISHSEARVDVNNLDLFVSSYQSVAPLAIGELWALPAMFRLALIESVRRMALRTLERVGEIEKADAWAARIEVASGQGAATLEHVLDEFTDAPPRLSAVFISRFLRQLRLTRGSYPPLMELEQWIAERALTDEVATARATQHLALTQVMMANSITSLRTLAHLDWRTFVERQSVLEAVLRTDPASFHAGMTFGTRDHYRHVVERIARRTQGREEDVAHMAVAFARARLNELGPQHVRAHVGYYLVDDGLDELESATGYRPKPREAVHRWVRRHPDVVFGSSIAGAIAAALAAVLWLAGPDARTAWLAVVLVTLIPAIHIALAAVDQLVTALLPPRTLPALDLQRSGIPAELRTAVVIPTLFDSVASVHESFDHLEVQFLANRGARLHFAVLSDFTDSPDETRPEDTAIVAAAVARVDELNARYAPGTADAFYAFHRPRRWNAQQSTWMGWERKRGKLAEFNHCLRGGAQDAFSAIAGNVEPLREVRYVITLDSDTVLPPGTAPDLIGTLAHPLNRAEYDAAHGRVVRGYGILQPRVGVSLPSAHRSLFAAIHSGHPGVDPYTTAVSDVYQDLFGEGSFTGKGIYDVDVFEQATHGRFPENTLLSHDLIEGSYARAGLATGITVYDDYPTRYLTFTRRKHRWIRGDWQLLRWLTRRVPGPQGEEANRLPLLSRWKILDNLRRSLVEIGQLLFLVAGWTFLPGSPLRWTVLGLAAIAVPWLLSLLLAGLRPPFDRSWRAYYAAVGRDAITSAQQFGLALAFLPHQAWISADAIVRTLWRLLVTKRNLLEWQTASNTEHAVAAGSGGAWRALGPAAALAAGGALLTITRTSGSAPLALSWSAIITTGGIAVLWAASPAIAHALSMPAVRRRQRWTDTQQATAMRFARLHWEFFDRFVTTETQWLAPDNFQEDPAPVVAMRTSPTNIGLQLLAIGSAHDLGFITTIDMTRRLELAFRSLERMRRFRGHFFNWYDLHDLRVLEPAYVSTVDSGNLAGHLLAVKQACLAARAGQLSDDRNTPARARPDGSGSDDDRAAHADVTARLDALAERAATYAAEMDFGFLFDAERELFSIGYQHDTHALDASCYDLLASESRLASFIAVARDDVPLDHWFRLGRSLTHAAGATALVSWSGSMFEYLMPALVMRAYPFTLLDQTYQGAVRRQIEHGAQLGVPWGVSESAYNVRDRQLTYQYRAFGVPDLALKRGLGRDLVIAPYASALALMVSPDRALQNLAALEAMNALGPFGFRDAVDYTRPDPGSSYAVVGNYMAHHIGMTLVALTNALTDNVWQARFHADLLVRSAELLLHERIPRRLVLQATQQSRADEAPPRLDVESPAVREFGRADTARPHIALLGRQPYTVMVSQGGSGFSRYEDIAVTRWRADGTTDATGQFCYVKDITAGRVWSAAHHPVCAPADAYRALLAADRVTFHRSDGDIETRTEIAVVPEDAAEIRSVTVTNHALETREIELTSYGEVVLGPADADRAHPAFANLFVETEWHEWCTAITALRRPRAAAESPLWCVHVVDTSSAIVGPVTCETDRARFIGRGRTTRAPIALESDGPLAGTTGSVLDPIFALRTRLRLEPGESATATFTTLIATTRKRAFELADRYHDSHTAQRALDLAWTSRQVELRELGLTPADAAVFQELAGCLLYPGPELRAPLAELQRNRGAQPLLWATGISGDAPIVIATIDGADGLPTLRQLYAAHHFWRRRGLTVELVVLFSQPASYLQELHDRIMEALFASSDMGLDQTGGVFVRNADALAPDTLLMLRATARIILPCDGRSLAHFLDQVLVQEEAQTAETESEEAPPRVLERRSPASLVERGAHAFRHHNAPHAPFALSRPGHSPDPVESSAAALPDAAPLRFDNGFGGMNAEGAYELRVHGDVMPPAPWVNVIANPRGGFVVSERGAGFSWTGNSHFFRLTPWHNDPVSDPISDVIYLRDDATDDVWTATPAPCGHDTPYTVRHGAGSSVFECERNGIATRLTLAMADDEPVRLSILRVANTGTSARRIVVTAYVEWTLGAQREHTQHHVCTEFDARLHAMFAQNHFDPHFGQHVAFCALSEPVSDYTADRRAFLGRNGSVSDPAGLRDASLGGAAGIGLDPCAALRCVLQLAPGETREVVVVLGAADSDAAAHEAVSRFRELHTASAAAARGIAQWQQRLSVITVRTPEPAFDALLNQWLLYQTLSCRMWARSALYQSSGAYGFRDQLQDALALVHAEPALARAHILRSAARQFVEGDVQHWWHPHSGRGVRTRFSDDLVWLPYVVEQYVTRTGDATVLDDYVPFLTMRALAADEHELYDLPTATDEHASVYEHCLRALRKACTVGAHGLPLIGTGDWNDGMNRVGAEGRGESVWLAWFLTATLRAFAVHTAQRGDHAVTEELLARADAYAVAVEAHGWDGEWYRRAFFDDGTPLGSSASTECRIDSIAQSWSVISGAGLPQRQTQAMRALDKLLVDDEARLLMLLTPPFDHTSNDPGYIRGYLPGVRENGAQYTHAAVWAVLATAMGGDAERAFELFQYLNPLLRTRTPAEVATYKVEPYVVAADVYTAPGQLGRGGWTWYTGAAGWLYRVGLENLLGFERRGDALRFAPRVPAAWPQFAIDYRFGTSLYAIIVQDPGRIAASTQVQVLLDGRLLDGIDIPLVDDGLPHDVLVRVATAAPTALADTTHRRLAAKP
jgi:cyclic beta-1,2-glucan synthetase